MSASVLNLHCNDGSIFQIHDSNVDLMKILLAKKVNLLVTVDIVADGEHNGWFFDSRNIQPKKAGKRKHQPSCPMSKLKIDPCSDDKHQPSCAMSKLKFDLNSIR